MIIKNNYKEMLSYLNNKMCKIGASLDSAYIPNCQGKERHNNGALVYTQCSFFEFPLQIGRVRDWSWGSGSIN